jgi:polyhydroxyalkanoate synthesis regulator phasin
MSAPKSSRSRSTKRSPARPAAGADANGTAGLVDQLTSRVLAPLNIVMLTRERIQETLDDAAARGRLTRGDADALVVELVRLGRQQTEELLADIQRLLEQVGPSATRQRVSDGIDLLARTAERAKQSVGIESTLPILGYDDLTAAHVQERLGGLTPGELRKVRDYERRHANRKSVLAAVERLLSA